MLPWEDLGKVVATAVGKTVGKAAGKAVDAMMADHLGGVTVPVEDQMTVVDILGDAENDVVLQEVGHRDIGVNHRNHRSFR